MTEQLTPEGREYALEHLQSIVARVALWGYDSGDIAGTSDLPVWPVAFVETAIRVMNEDGALQATHKEAL